MDLVQTGVPVQLLRAATVGVLAQLLAEHLAELAATLVVAVVPVVLLFNGKRCK